MNILITGGAGFVGSNLCNTLISDNHNIFILDNFHTGRKENLLHLEDKKNFNFIEHDIRNSTKIRKKLIKYII